MRETATKEKRWNAQLGSTFHASRTSGTKTSSKLFKAHVILSALFDALQDTASVSPTEVMLCMPEITVMAPVPPALAP